MKASEIMLKQEYKKLLEKTEKLELIQKELQTELTIQSTELKKATEIINDVSDEVDKMSGFYGSRKVKLKKILES